MELLTGFEPESPELVMQRTLTPKTLIVVLICKIFRRSSFRQVGGSSLNFSSNVK